MTEYGFRITTAVTRNDPHLMSRFAEIPVANIADCMNRSFCLDSEIRMINEAPGVKMVGTAFTVKTRPGDNLMVLKALDLAPPGTVIIIDAGSAKNHAILGEIMVLMAKNKGIAGFVIDGCCRDYDTIRHGSFPVFSRGITPQGPYKDGPGEINYTISCGGAVVAPGDIVVGDHDGLVIVPYDKALGILREAEAVMEKEKVLISRLLEGKPNDLTWVDERLSERGCLVEAPPPGGDA